MSMVRDKLPMGYYEGLSGLTRQITLTLDFLGFSAVRIDVVECEG